MKSTKQKHSEIETRRRKAEERRRVLAQRAAERRRLRDYKIALARDEVPVDTTQLAPSNSYSIPDFVERGTYRPEPFVCMDCGIAEVWTPLQQKWWYETAKGDVFTKAVRCRASAPGSAHAKPPRAVCIWKGSPGRSLPLREGGHA